MIADVERNSTTCHIISLRIVKAISQSSYNYSFLLYNYSSSRCHCVYFNTIYPRPRFYRSQCPSYECYLANPLRTTSVKTEINGGLAMYTVIDDREIDLDGYGEDTCY